jgi:hypothetical protein
MKLLFYYIEKEDTIITIALIFILGLIKAVLLIEVILRRIGIFLSSNQGQIYLVAPFGIADISISARRLGIGVGLPCLFSILRQLSLSNPLLSSKEELSVY